jgi:hypothetical protein
MSSQPAKSTRTCTPVCCVNFAVLARKMVSSGIDELGRPQHAQRGAVLDRLPRRLHIGHGNRCTARPAGSMPAPAHRHRRGLHGV